jgi:sortase A
MKRALLIAALVFVGLSVLLYPWFAQHYAQQSMKQAASDYDQTVAGMKKEQLEAEYRKARAYNEAVSGKVIQDPFIPGSGTVLPKEYSHTLNVDGTGLMATLSVPSLKLELPVYHGAGEDSLQRGVGHLPTTALPVGGLGTHCVLAGHRGLPTKALFTDLDKLKRGDQFTLNTLGHILAYEVDQISVVTPDDTSLLQPTRGRDYVTLLTCTPYAINSHRLLVRGHRVPSVAFRNPRPPTALSGPDRLLLVVGIATALVMLLLIALALWRRHRRARTISGSAHT